ncbi:hypothetical protein V8G54_034705 [Vigna mungo]|uniref:Uncharacterized protein n=1 Tax=Vigna mungo TaxID=3915 RepID=A0AAQ3MDL1_VIGMU
MMEIMKICELYYSNGRKAQDLRPPHVTSQKHPQKLSHHLEDKSLQKLKSMTEETLANSLASSIINSKYLFSGSNTVIERLGLCFWPDQSTEEERLVPSFHHTYHLHSYESQT